MADLSPERREELAKAASLAVVAIESVSPDPSVRQYAQAVTDALAPLIAEWITAERRDCKYGDPTCPCQDGDQCHYEGESPMRPPSAYEAGAAEVRARVEAVLADAWRDESPSALYPEGRHLYRWPADVRDQLRAALEGERPVRPCICPPSQVSPSCPAHNAWPEGGTDE